MTKCKGGGILNPDYSKLKILTHKQILQRLPIALAKVKAGNNSASLLNEIRQIVYSLYQSKQITKKVYNKYKYKYKDGYCKPHVLVFKLTNKLNLRIGEKIIAL